MTGSHIPEYLNMGSTNKGMSLNMLNRELQSEPVAKIAISSSYTKICDERPFFDDYVWVRKVILQV